MTIDETTFKQICNENGIAAQDVDRIIESIKKHTDSKKQGAIKKPEPNYSCVILDPTGTVPQGLTCVVLKSVFNAEKGMHLDDQQMAGKMIDIIDHSNYGAVDTVVHSAKKTRKHGFQIVSKDVIYCYPVKHPL